MKKEVWMPLAVLVLIGSIPGALMLKNVDAGIIKIIFGIVVILVGIEMLFRERNTKKLEENKIILGIIGLISGALCGLFGVGALLAVYVGRVTGTGDEFKANISAVFIMDNTFRIILYMVLGVITIDTLKQAVIVLPFALLGLFLGMKSSKILDDKLVKKLVIILLIISGAMMIVKNL